LDFGGKRLAVAKSSEDGNATTHFLCMEPGIYRIDSLIEHFLFFIVRHCDKVRSGEDPPTAKMKHDKCSVINAR